MSDSKYTGPERRLRPRPQSTLQRILDVTYSAIRKNHVGPAEQRSEFWPEPSAHRLHWERHNCPLVYEYDPADDGPEVEIIKRLLPWMLFEKQWKEMLFEEVFLDRLRAQ